MANKEASLLIKIKEAGGEVLDKVNAKTLLLGASVAVVAKQLFDFGVKAFEAFAEAEQATNKLNQSLVQQGMYTAELSKQYRDLASELQKKSTFSDEEIMGAQATMQAYLGQTQISKELMKATLDLAAAKKMDLGSAAEMVAKSIGTGTNALARQGIELDANASKSEKLARVTDSLNSKFGGQAETAAQGTGSLKTLANVTGELMEKVGGALTPLIILLTEKISAMSQALDEATLLWQVLHGAMFAISAVFSVIENSVKNFVGQIVQQFRTVVDVWTAIANGDFAAAKDAIVGHFGKMKEMATANFNTMVGDIQKSYGRHVGIMAGQFQNEEDLLRQSEARKGEITKEAAEARRIEKQKEYDEDQAKRLEAFEKEQMDFQMKSEQDAMRMEVERQIRADADTMEKLEALNRTIAFETNRTAVIQAEEEKRLLLKKFYDTEQAKLDAKQKEEKKKREEKEKKEEFDRMDAADKFDAIIKTKQMQRATDTMNYLSQMQNSKSKELVAIGRAAATANIIMQTAQAVMNIWGWASGIPIVGPAIAVGLSAAVIAYGAESISKVNSAQMAEGGIVTARPGGMLATIGEAGRDEAVIPLEDGRVPGMGTTINLTVYGGLLGDDASAYELGRALDRQFKRLEESGDRISGR